MNEWRKRHSWMGTASTITPKGDYRENHRHLSLKVSLTVNERGEKPLQYKYTVNKTIENVNVGIKTNIPKTKPARRI